MRLSSFGTSSKYWHLSCSADTILNLSRSAEVISRKDLPASFILILFLTGFGLSSHMAAQEKETLPKSPATTSDQPQSDQEEKSGISFKSFHRDLGNNFLGLFSRESVLPFSAGVLGTGVSLELDDNLHDYFRNVDNLGQEQRRFPAVGNVGEVLGNRWFLLAGTGSLLLAAHSTSNDRFQDMTYAWTQGYVLNNLLSEALKQGVRRERPNGQNTRSFSSGHAANAFTFATIINHYYGSKAGIPAYGIAGLVAVSRMEKNVHYLSDVVMGATLGYIVGRTVTRGRDKGRRVAVIPTISPGGEGVGLMLSARF